MVKFYDPKTHKVVKINHYDPLKLISSEFDSDVDGVMDVFRKYNEFEEVIE